MSDSIKRPATEIEIAEAIRWADDITGLVIRRLAFERDTLKSERREQEQAVISAASTIVDSWDDWEGEATTEAQRDQSDITYRHVLMCHIADTLWRSFGWLLRD